MMLEHSRRALALCAFLAACANGSTDDASSPPQDSSATVTDDLSTLDAFCAALGRAACSDAVVRGCGAKSKDACSSARGGACMRDVPQGTTYVPDGALACATATKSAYADAVLTGDELAAIDAACGPKVFAGPGAARAPCTSPYDCRSDLGLVCLVPTDRSSMQGKCMKPTSVRLGGSCAAEAAVCADDAYCEQASKTCKARPIEGEPCSPTLAPCAPGLECPGAGPFAVACKPLGAAGDPCSAGADCTSNVCDKAKGQSQGNCADRIELMALDAACADFVSGP